MNEHDRDSQMSALFDGQLPADETVLATRRLLKDSVQQQHWSRYALIGASLRGEPLLQRAAGEDLASRIQRQLAVEPVLADPVADAAPAVRAGISRWAWGGAMAASVALAAILVARWQAPAEATLVAANTPAATAAPVGNAPAAPALAATEAVSDTPAKAYTTPGDPVSPQARFGTPLVGYVAVHSDYAAPVGLRGPVSALMYGQLDPTEDTVEMTEAEVGARR